jgi:hypothetical protein
LLHTHSQEITLYDFSEIRKQSALEEAKESEPEVKARIMTFFEFDSGAFSN